MDSSSTHIQKQQQQCACKGIRKCGICQPDLDPDAITLSMYEDLIKRKKLFVFCPCCNAFQPIECTEQLKHVEKFLHSANERCQCFCENKTTQSGDHSAKLNIDGVLIYRNFVTVEEEAFLCEQLNSDIWIDSQSGFLLCSLLNCLASLIIL